MLLKIMEASLLAASCSLDAFTVALGCGTNKIKIPLLSNLVIDLFSSAILGISLFIGIYAQKILPPGLTDIISFVFLFTLGLIRLLDSVQKALIKKYSDKLNKEVSFKLWNFRFLLRLYINPEEADVDSSKDISPRESISLAASISLDGLAVGIGAAMGGISAPLTFIASLIINGVAIALGAAIGNRLANRFSYNLSWISGLILIAIAIFK